MGWDGKKRDGMGWEEEGSLIRVSELVGREPQVLSKGMEG